MRDVSADIVRIAREGVQHVATFTYDEVRPMPCIHNPYGDWAFVGDCSCWVTQVWKWAGAPDPNGLDYDGEGDTQTLTDHGKQITLAEVAPADVVVYDAFGPLSNQHTAVIVEGGPDPLTSSFGHQGAPELVHVSQDGRVPTYLRFDTTAPDAKPVPDSPASRVPARFRPAGTPPVLAVGATNPQAWVVYWRLCLRAAGFWPRIWPVGLGGFGKRTQATTIRFKVSRTPPLVANAEVGAESWAKVGIAQ
jgi:hypothetical protein